ncbi:hypothetical protein GBAR_LOCUS8625, partial [Geodia barretti]
ALKCDARFGNKILRTLLRVIITSFVKTKRILCGTCSLGVYWGSGSVSEVYRRRAVSKDH